jgi:hypothetical protein
VSTLLSTVRGAGPVVVAPIVYRLAARLEQVELEEMLQDAATAAFVLRSAQGLFGLPVVVNHFQLGLELEALGAPLPRDGRGLPLDGETRPAELSAGVADAPLLQAATDVAARLSSELRGTAPVLGVLTGPATLAGLRGGDLEGVAELYAVLARRYAEAGVAGVLLAEAPAAAGVAGRDRVLTELANICRFYNVASILLAPAGVEPAGPVDLVLPADEALPPELFAEQPEGTAAERRTGRRGLLLTAGEVPADADPETVTAWVELFGGAPLRTGR